MTDGNRSYCQIMIGRAMTGLVGLIEIYEQLAAENVPADADGLDAWLVAAIKAHNYVPRPAIAQYASALVREYARFLEERATGAPSRLWRDPRKELQSWYPTLFEEKCDGCGECITVCPRSVLGWNPDHTVALVLEPYECAPACQLCARACPRSAIMMPAQSTLHQRVDSGPRSSRGAGCDTAECDGCSSCAGCRS